MTFSLGVVLAVVTVVAIWIGIGVIRARRRLRAIRDYIDLPTIARYLENLKDSEDDAAYLIFEDATSRIGTGIKGRSRFVQFAKAPAHPGSLVCHFPKAPWSEPYLQGLERVLETKRRGFKEVAGRSGEPVTGFIVIDGLTVSDAVALTDTIFREVFACTVVRARVWGWKVPGIEIPASHS
jgi:hypothetical protein